MSKFSGRKIGIAKRCQLLTGSFSGNDYACPCEGPAQCKLTQEERHELAEDLTVVYSQKRNRLLFETEFDLETEE